ncbi:MAG: dTDP-4-dehydrorhamnose 3,5-epimerase family protein [Nitrospirae bacterium]|nr:dTDP-4-dehydrorhamnose 3,5-epimerase family protein [Nitrospirota bacterium]
MRFAETSLAGAFLIESPPAFDGRGYFARGFCHDEFSARGIGFVPVQTDFSWNRKAGTLRGLHYQIAPHSEAKIACCVRGAMFDVIVDLRENSPTCRRWFGVELKADDCKMLYIPEGFAHGYQTLADDTLVLYLMSQPFQPEAARGIRWDDPALGVVWPEAAERIISERDMTW